MFETKINQFLALAAIFAGIMLQGTSSSSISQAEIPSTSQEFQLTPAQIDALPKRIRLRFEIKYEDLPEDVQKEICHPPFVAVDSIKSWYIPISLYSNFKGYLFLYQISLCDLYDRQGNKIEPKLEKPILFRRCKAFVPGSILGILTLTKIDEEIRKKMDEVKVIEIEFKEKNFIFLSSDSGTIMPIPQTENQILTFQIKPAHLNVTFSDKFKKYFQNVKLKRCSKAGFLHESIKDIENQFLYEYLPELYHPHIAFDNGRISCERRIGKNEVLIHDNEEKKFTPLYPYYSDEIGNFMDYSKYCLEITEPEIVTMPDGTKIKLKKKVYKEILFNGKRNFFIKFDKEGGCDIQISLGRQICSEGYEKLDQHPGQGRIELVINVI